jgi:hypothetical protein
MTVIAIYLLSSKWDNRMRFDHSAIRHFRDLNFENEHNGAFSRPMALRLVVDDYCAHAVGIVDVHCLC